jgi:hypothetical protein
MENLSKSLAKGVNGPSEIRGNGILTTPVHLVKQMVDLLPERVFISSTTTFLDPACGYGTFLKYIYAKLRFYGHSHENIVSRIYGIDKFSPANETKDLFPNIIKKDFMTDMPKQWPDKFDVIVSNPPYASNADVGFLDKAYDISNGLVLFVHPSTYIIEKKSAHKPFVRLREKVSKHISHLELFNGNGIFGIGLYVPCVITVIDKNKKSDNFRMVNHMYEQDTVLSQDKISDVSLFGYDPAWSSFYKRMKDVSSKIGSLHDAALIFKSENRYLRNPDAFYVEFTRITAGNKRGSELKKEDSIHKNDFFIIISKYQLTVKRNGTPKYDIWYEFETENEAKNFLKYLQTNFVRGCLAINKFAQSLNSGELRAIPLVDFNEEWDDEKLYEKFKVSEKEREFIEKIILPYYDI